MARKKNKRVAILTAAASIFNTKGFHQANISEIAEEAGIGKGTVYEYFKSKDDLFLEVIAFNIDQYIERIQQAVSNNEGFQNKLDAFIETHQAIIGENYEATGHFLSTQNPMNGNGPEVIKIFMAARKKVCNILSDIFRIGKAQGAIGFEDTEFASDIAYDMISRVSIRGYLNRLTNTQIKEEREKFVVMLSKGIGI